jgi:ribosomal protein L37E
MSEVACSNCGHRSFEQEVEVEPQQVSVVQTDDELVVDGGGSLTVIDKKDEVRCRRCGETKQLGEDESSAG